MVDLQNVCCMCGDVGFSDKLFRCHKCLNRFQHSYCSNYYRETGPTDVCNWCRSEERSSTRSHGGSLKKSPVTGGSGSNTRSESLGGRMKLNEVDEESEEKGKSSGRVPSPRPTPRRYKLLKDVMC